MTAQSGWLTAGVICRRELVRFTRQPARIAAAIGTPLLLWLFFAAGFSDSVQGQAISGSGELDAGYDAFLLPGAMTLIAVFAAIFSSISVIEDRNAGWLQSVLVSPVPRWSIALGKICGGALVAFAQAAVLLVIVPFVGGSVSLLAIVMVLAGLFITSFAMTAMGVLFAWRSETTAGFHAVMNLVFMPMWLLSGAFFSLQTAATWLSWLMRINPLTWCTQAIRQPLLGDVSAAWLPLGIAVLFALIMMAAATAVVSRPHTL